MNTNNNTKTQDISFPHAGLFDWIFRSAQYPLLPNAFSDKNDALHFARKQEIYASGFLSCDVYEDPAITDYKYRAGCLVQMPRKP